MPATAVILNGRGHNRRIVRLDGIHPSRRDDPGRTGRPAWLVRTAFARSCPAAGRVPGSR